MLAASLRSADRTEDQRRQDRANVLEAAYVLAAAEPTVPRAVETFARVLERLCDVDANLLDRIAPLVRRLWRWLPGQALVRLVPLLLRVRRDAGWDTSPGSTSNEDDDDEALEA